MKFSAYTTALLEDIEARIDPYTEEELEARWNTFLAGEFDGDVFSPNRKKHSVPGIEVRQININDAIEDYEMMVNMQFAAVSASLASGGRVLSIRSNYGTGILSTPFGAPLFMMSREANTLPTTRVVPIERLDEMLEAGLPDINAGLCGKVFVMSEIYAEIFDKYPKIRRYVHGYHPDTQGPVDIAELLFSDQLFYEMYDNPERLHAFLRLICDEYIQVIEKWYSIIPAPEPNVHYGFFMKGGILLRDDSAMNLSPELYREFGYPYDSMLLTRFGGGVVHFCGRGDHYIDIITSCPALTGINMSQPHLNDMEKIYSCTVDRGIPLFAFPKAYAEADIGRGFNGLMHV